jgi:Anticodon binding domain
MVAHILKKAEPPRLLTQPNFSPLRVGIIGHEKSLLKIETMLISTSPGIFDVLAVLGRDESLGRIADQAG